MKMTVGDNVMYFNYDASGVPVSIVYNGTTYYYVTNLQGDIVGIVNQSGNQIVGYTYDAWGNILTTTGSSANTLGKYNPLRYRGYVYDPESRMYYLQSRYYDPEMGRFISADGLVSTGQGLLGNNMFTYCGNCSTMYSDKYGTRREVCITAFEDEGSLYILDQSDGPWSELPFGSSTVGEMGCALVAVYNAMISLGDPKYFMEIYNFYDGYPSGLTDHGKNGLFVGYMAAYFRAEGYDVVVRSAFDLTQFMLHTQGADACIMLYQRGAIFNSSGHYVEYAQYKDHYIARNTAEKNGNYIFNCPIEYGLSQDRYFFIGIFVNTSHS